MTTKLRTYLVDTSNSDPYCVSGESFDRTIVRYVGSMVNGRIEYDRNQPVTHRTTSNLR